MGCSRWIYIFSYPPTIPKGKQHCTNFLPTLSGWQYHPSKLGRLRNISHGKQFVTHVMMKWSRTSHTIQLVQWLACKDYVSYQNGYEADKKGNKEDPNAIEMHCSANRAAQRQQLVGGLSHFCVHQETPVGRNRAAWALAMTQKWWGCFREKHETYPCFWLKFW